MIDANRIGADEGGPVKQRRLFTGAQGQAIVADAVGRGSPEGFKVRNSTDKGWDPPRPIAFSSEADTGLRQENASKQKTGASVLIRSEPRRQAERPLA